SIPFNSVAVHGTSGGRKVYKLFSQEVPPERLLNEMFVNVSNEMKQFVWHAYPILSPRPSADWPPFTLHPASSGDQFQRGGVYYANAMETPVSCMETEAIAAKNVALLVLRDLKRRGAAEAVFV
ncbi:unnamed protein product, partial [Polarella glacialis]